MISTAKSFYRPREAAELLDIPPSTLRHWEKVFPQLNPERSHGGTRRYTQKDIDTCVAIKSLLRDKGMSIESAKKAMENYRIQSPNNPRKCRNSKEAIELLDNVKDMTVDPLIIEKVEAVIKYLNTVGKIDTIVKLLNDLDDVERSSI